jgi:hypothetical protein
MRTTNRPNSNPRSPGLIAPPPPPPELGAETVTVTDLLVEPPDPVQVSVNVVVALSAALVTVPLVGCVPVHPPEAAQVVAF